MHNAQLCFISYRLILLIIGTLFSIQALPFTFKKYKVDNGLSENTVRAIFQDRLGFMWFGTKDGLNRFDGNEFKIFKNNPEDTHSIGNNFIYDIYQDIDDNLWVATDHQLYIYHYDSEQFTPFRKTTKEGKYIQSTVTTICAENDSIIWIGTYYEGLFCYNIKQNVLEHIPQLDVSIIWKIFKDKSGGIWIGSRENLTKYNRETNSFISIKTHSEKEEFEENDILSIYEDSDGELWVGTWSSGLACLNKSTHKFNFYFDQHQQPYITHIRSIYEYEKSKLFIGADDGLYSFDKKTKKCVRLDKPKDTNSLSDQNVYSIFKDTEGGFWFGTFFGGVNYLSPNSRVFEHYYPSLYPNSLSGKAISQFCEDTNGNLWIATEDGGLNYFNTQTKEFNTYLPQPNKNSLSYHNIHSVVLDEDQLWIGTFSRGIDVLNLKTNIFKNYSYNKNDSTTINDNCIFAIYRTSQKEIYVGTPFGLNKYNPASDKFIRIKEVSQFVHDIKEDYQGDLWVASYGNGIFRYHPKIGKWKNYRNRPNDKTSICFDKVISILTDDKQRLWFGTEGGGFSKYNYDTDNFSTFDSRNGLPNDVVYGILDDQYGNLWVSTTKGISKVDLHTMQIKTYTKEDGLQSNQFNYKSSYKAKNGIFYFGGINGFNAFNPDQLKETPFSMPVIITQMEVLNDDQPQKIDFSKPITLKHNQASFSIHFIGLSFQAQDKNKYAYLMENLNSKWINIGKQRNISFFNLPPGKYIFRVKGSNNDDAWNRCNQSIEITILPPFWKSNLAYIFYTIFIFAGLYFMIHFYIQKDKKKQMQRIEELNLEKEKEMYDSKINFFTNIAHEIRTPVSLIKAPLECILDSGDGKPETKENLSIIEKNTDRLLDLINQLLDFRKIETNAYPLSFAKENVNELLSNICFRFKTTAQQKNIHLELHLPSHVLMANLDKEALTKIVSNLLTNGLKFAQRKIDITLSEHLKNSHPYIEIIIQDDGIGIPEKFKSKIFEPFFQIENEDTISRKNGTGIGLALVRQLVEHHGGTINLKTVQPSGACFLIHIPESKEASLHNRISEISNDITENSSGEIMNTKEGKEDAKYHLLIVEDSAELKAFLTQNLDSEYQVSSAKHGQEAIHILENKPIDIIISDIVMPVMDGLELAKSVKQSEQFCHIPLILLSAKTNIQTKVEGLEVGADSYIEKPFSVAYLKAQIASLIENRNRIMERFSTSPVIPYGAIARDKKDEEFLARLNEKIEHNLTDEMFSIEKLANSLSMSQSNLQRKVKGLSGMVPNDYIRVIKLKKAAQLMIQGEYRINEICYIVGFSSPSYFSKCFHKQFGMQPKEFIKSLEGQ